MAGGHLTKAQGSLHLLIKHSQNCGLAKPVLNLLFANTEKIGVDSTNCTRAIMHDEYL